MSNDPERTEIVPDYSEMSRSDLRHTARYVRSIDQKQKQVFIDYVMGVANGTITPKYKSSVRTCENIAAQLIRHEDKMALEYIKVDTSSPEQHVHLHGSQQGASIQDIIQQVLNQPEYLDYLTERGSDES